jgi:16S rRNA (guanine966-N2)-methyltransferase
MRIIAGEFRGRRLKTVRGLAVRPTSDKLRETIFNILRSEVPGSTFIDCYAGSGAVGLEAASRGASRVFLIEKDPAAARVMEQNIAALGEQTIAAPGAGSAVRVVRADVKTGMRKLAAQGVRATICFLDPPYASLQVALKNIEWLVSGAALLHPEGMIILEHARKDASPEQIGKPPNRWERSRLLLQGSSAVSFYRRMVPSL